MPAADETNAFIDGGTALRVEGARIQLENPWTHDPLPPILCSGASLVDHAVRSAWSAFLEHRHVSKAQRSEWLLAAAQELEGLKSQIVNTIVCDIGKPRKAAEVEVARTIAFAKACARAVHDLRGEVLPLDTTKQGSGRFGFTHRVPYGVIGAITPFNAPANLLMQKVAPALVTGNAVVVKPSPEGSRVAVIIAECFSRGSLPSGLFNVVMGGKDEALELAAHVDVAAVTVTGGTEAGRQIAAAAGLKPFFGELGGNSANIVCADADLEDASRRIAASAFEASGQQCISAQRIIVEAPVFEPFLALLQSAAARLKTGDPDSQDTDLGPVINSRAADRIVNAIAAAERGGARILGGPNRNGCCIAPTIVTDARDDSGIVKEEIFGPVAVVMRAENFDHAIAIANASKFGLQASCFTNRLDKAMHISDALNVGSVWINEGSRFRLDNYPFGGFGDSGSGREGLPYALHEYTQWKFTGIRTPSN